MTTESIDRPTVPANRPVDREDVVRRALSELRSAKSEVAESRARSSEPVAVVGVGCRFPGGVVGVESFWDLLVSGGSGVGVVPADRWCVDDVFDGDVGVVGKTYSRHGGFVDGVGDFDAGLFGVSPREAVGMDPQHRLMLEVAWEALEDSGCAPDSLRGTATGVFVGMGSGDYAQVGLEAGGLAGIDAYAATGNASNFGANRLSYALGLEGPSVVVDTACSSSLVALHLAVNSVRSGESELALVGGVNVMASPVTTIALSQGRMLSVEGACRTFDAGADGYVRGEGCGVVVLKRLSVAQAAGDRIMAVIKGTATNQDGKSSGVTVPRASAQQKVVRAALGAAGVEGSDVGYVEAHGTGTALGDPIEVRALASVLGSGRAVDKPLMVGSVKTNIGHLEAAAGIAGLIKTVLVLERGVVPPHRNLSMLNPHVDWENIAVRVPTRVTPWVGDARVAGVSSFGFGGTNAHAILGSAPVVESEPCRDRSGVAVVKLAGNGVEAVRASARGLVDFLSANPDVTPQQVAWTANTARADLPDRAVVSGGSRAELISGLRSVADGAVDGSVLGPVRVAESVPRVAFVVPGHGARVAGIFSGVHGVDPVVTQVVDEVVRICGFPLSVLLDGGDRSSELLTDTAIAQPALYAVGVALGAWWRARGVEPAVIVGHSVGAYAAAALAGVFTVAEGAMIVGERARLTAELADTGAVEAGMRSVCERIKFLPATVELLMDANWITSERSFSGPTHWVKFEPKPVDLQPVANALATWGADVVIDLASEFVLTTEDESDDSVIGTMPPGGGAPAMVYALSKLWLRGAQVRWREVTPRPQLPVMLPHYPFQRERYWIPSPVGRPNPRGGKPLAPSMTTLATGQLIAETEISVKTVPFLHEHVVHGLHVVPGVVFIELVLRCSEFLFGTDAAIRSMSISRPLVLAPDASASVQVIITPGPADGYDASVYSLGSGGKWNVHLRADVTSGVGGTRDVLVAASTQEAEEAGPEQSFDGLAFYSDFWHPDFQLGPSFQLITSAKRVRGHAEASIAMPAQNTQGVRAGIRPELLLLDTAVQLVALAAGEVGVPLDRVRLGTGYQKMAIYKTTPVGPIKGTAVASTGADGSIVGSVSLTDSNDEPIGIIEGVSFAQVGAEMLRRIAESTAEHGVSARAVAKPDLAAIAALSRDERISSVVGHLRKILAAITSAPADSFRETESLVDRLDSLMLIELKDGIETDFSIEVNTEDLFEAATLAGLGPWIAGRLTLGGHAAAPSGAPVTSERAAGRRNSKLMTVEQMSRKAILDPPIIVRGGDVTDVPVSGATFLTGATGFVGAYLLGELLSQTDGDVLCLVRADDESHALRRIESNLDKYGINCPQSRHRIVPVVGDLALPLFGLSAAAFDSLHGIIGNIVHCGGMVKWTYPYDGLSAANVDGTVSVLRLATVGTPRPVHFISTVGVFSSRLYTKPTVDETTDLDSSGPLAVGYAQTKWVAEKMMRLAHERGVPTTIHRINTGGDSTSGAFNRQDHLSMMIKGCVEAGLAPLEADMPLQPAPIDYVARSIVALAGERSSIGGTFHLVHPNQLSWRQLFDYVEDFGYKVERLSFADWRDKVVNRRVGTMALVGLTPFLHESVDDVQLPYSESKQTRSILTELGIECPDLDRDLVHRYLQKFVSSGFLDAPRVV